MTFDFVLVKEVKMTAHLNEVGVGFPLFQKKIGNKILTIM
jgi:hypothetical protein